MYTVIIVERLDRWIFFGVSILIIVYMVSAVRWTSQQKKPREVVRVESVCW